MNIRGLYKTSLIDYPGRISSVIFTGGCNLSCRYCHNPDLARNDNSLDLFTNDEILHFLKKRRHLIDALTVSGGEPTISKNIGSFLNRVRELSLPVKLDTNGLLPGVVQELLESGLLKYVALDVKTSPGKYRDLAGRDIDFSLIARTVEILKEHETDYEIRTTCVPGYAEPEDFEEIKNAIGTVERYYIQQFVSSVPLIDPELRNISPYPVVYLEKIKDYVLTFSETCEIRGI